MKKINSDVMQSDRATAVESGAGRRHFLELLTVGSLSEVTELSIEQEGFTYVKPGGGECARRVCNECRSPWRDIFGKSMEGQKDNQ